MLTRLYVSGTGPGSDSAGLDRLLDSNRHGDVRLDSDRVVVAEHGPDRPLVGCLIWRPCGLIHELVLAKDLPRGLGVARRVAAHSMTSYAIGEARAREYSIRQALFLIDSDNDAMLRFVREEMHGAEQRGIIFTVDF